MPVLMQRGHTVNALDTGYFNAGLLYATPPCVETTHKDIRRITHEDLRGLDAVVHMAEISNDPASALAPRITHDINHHGSVRLATLAKEVGVARFVYMSSCSVYGVATNGAVTEESAVNPQTAYAVCKTLVERDVRALADDSFSPTFLRNATAYGASPRMRFDIVLNNLSGLAWTSRKIALVSDGSPWRPLVHALDICQAIGCVLDAPRATIHNQVFNVGATACNYRIKEIAEIVAGVFPGCALSFGAQGADNRSYRVCFEKINTTLPGFSCEWDAERGARQLREIFERIDMTADVFAAPPFTRLKQLELLLNSGQIDEDFFWR